MLRTVRVGWPDIEKIVDILRGRVDSIPGAVKKIGDDGDTRVGGDGDLSGSQG